MVSFPDEFLKKVDRKARAQHRSRSELIREALRNVVAEPGRTRLSWRKAIARLRLLESQWTERWDSTDVIRRDRESHYGRENRR